MRVLLLLLSSFAVASCSLTPKPPPIQLNPKPTPLPAELFDCDREPWPWEVDADDVEIAVNETQRTGAGRDCRRQLRRVCLTLTALHQVTGECPDARPTAPRASTRTPLLE